jgi:hypothetical protein
VFAPKQSSCPNLGRNNNDNKYPLIRTARTHQHNTYSTLFQTANKFKKSFQSETKQIKNIIAQSIKEKWEEKKGFMNNFDVA